MFLWLKFIHYITKMCLPIRLHLRRESQIRRPTLQWKAIFSVLREANRAILKSKKKKFVNKRINYLLWTIII